jgi:hypothetical protein
MADLAAANMLHRKTRTVVSVLGIGIQVATVMILVGLVNGTVGGIAGRLESVGADVLFQPPDASLILGATTAVVPVSLASEMRERVAAVREVTPVLNRQVTQLGSTPESVNLWAVDYPSYAKISGGLVFVEGRPIEGPFEIDVDSILRRKHGLASPDLEEFVGLSLQYADYQMRYSQTEPGPPSIVSTVKINQAGFTEMMDTEVMFKKWFGEAKALRLLP